MGRRRAVPREAEPRDVGHPSASASTSGRRCNSALFWLAPLAIAFAGRVPQMLGPHWVADGDESTVGLMALHALSGRGVEGFFPGQAYGFSLVESLAGAALLRLGMDATSALKLGALVVFCFGITGWQALILKVTMQDRRSAFASALAIAICLSWGIWGMRLRGGYVTAFALQPWSLLLVSSPVMVSRIAGGLLAGVLALAQPIFLPGWLLWAAVLVWRHRPVAGAAAVLGGALVGAVSLRLAWPIPSTYWIPGIFTFPSLNSAARGGLGVFHAMTGVLENFDAPFHNRYLLLVAALTPVIPLLALARWRHDGSRWASLPQAWAAMALLLAVLPGPFLAEAPARYFLPAATQLAIIAGLEWRRWPIRAWMAASALGLLTLGGLPWSRPRLNEADELLALVRFLERERVEGVYSTSPLLQWQIMYYSHDGMPARWRHPSDRIPAYPRAVDEALWLGRTTALVGEVADGRVVRALPGCVVPTPRYFVLLRPQANLLAAAGFALNPPSRDPR